MLSLHVAARCSRDNYVPLLGEQQEEETLQKYALKKCFQQKRLPITLNSRRHDVNQSRRLFIHDVA